jgi:hypothetical protein
MKTARGALRELPTHLLKELVEQGLARESVLGQGKRLTAAKSRSLREAQTQEDVARANRPIKQSFFSRLGRWLRRLFRGAEVLQSSDPGRSSYSGGPTTPREKTPAAQFGNNARVEQNEENLNGHNVSAASMSPFTNPARTNDKELDRLVRSIAGEKVFGKITLHLITDELARRGEPYQHPIDQDGTLTIKDSDLTNEVIDGHLSLRPGVQRLLKAGSYKKINVETSDPVCITSAVRAPEVELTSLVPLVISDLHVAKVAVPALVKRAQDASNTPLTVETNRLDQQGDLKCETTEKAAIPAGRGIVI